MINVSYQIRKGGSVGCGAHQWCPLPNAEFNVIFFTCNYFIAIYFLNVKFLLQNTKCINFRENNSTALVKIK